MSAQTLTNAEGAAPSRMRRAMRTMFPLEPGERLVAVVLYTTLMLMVLSDWVGKVGADSLFVKQYGVRYIPLMYVLTPIGTLAISAVLFSALHRYSSRALLIGYVAAVIVASIAIQMLLPIGGLIFPVAYIFAHGVKEVLYLLFWMYAGNLYGG